METILRLLAENPESLGEIVKTYVFFSLFTNPNERLDSYTCSTSVASTPLNTILPLSKSL